MKLTGRCPKCGTDDIIRAKAVDVGDCNVERDMSIVTYGKPQALLFRDKHCTNVSAWVCAKCGFVEYYADKPATLKIRKTIRPR